MYRALAAGAAVLAFANYCTFSVTAIVAMGAAVAGAGLTMRGRVRLLLLPALLAAILISTPRAIYWKVGLILTGDSTSSLARIITYQRTFQAVQDHPLTGIGWGGLSARVQQDYLMSAAVGVGAGDQSRVGAADRAVVKAGDRAAGGVAASDAFFPFRDGPDTLIAAGVTAIVEPGGSVRDQDVIDAANEHDIALVFTGRRHFRH